MRILVTGGAGFIGSNFIEYWLHNHPQDEVVNFDLLTYAGNLENLRVHASNPKYSFIKGDITDHVAVAAVMIGIDIVVHFAAESHVDRSILDPAIFVRTNMLGTQILLEEALRNKVKRFHHVSTDEVFGSLTLDSESIFNEQSPFKPRSPYSASKAAADLLVSAYHTTYGLATTITNTSNNYGPYQFPEKFLPLMIIKALKQEPFLVYGDGLNVRDWLHVKDHCRAIDLVIAKGKPGETYCVGGENEFSNIEIVSKLCSILGISNCVVNFIKDRPGHDRRYAIDNKKIKTELDFELAHDFEKGLAETVAWYKINEEWWQRVMSGEYLEYFRKQYILR